MDADVQHMAKLMLLHLRECSHEFSPLGAPWCSVAEDGCWQRMPSALYTAPRLRLAGGCLAQSFHVSICLSHDMVEVVADGKSMGSSRAPQLNAVGTEEEDAKNDAVLARSFLLDCLLPKFCPSLDAHLLKLGLCGRNLLLEN